MIRSERPALVSLDHHVYPRNGIGACRWSIGPSRRPECEDPIEAILDLMQVCLKTIKLNCLKWDQMDAGLSQDTSAGSATVSAVRAICCVGMGLLRWGHQ